MLFPQGESKLFRQIVNRFHHALLVLKLITFHHQPSIRQFAFFESVVDIARHCIGELPGRRER
jgi:hypothetical protein